MRGILSRILPLPWKIFGLERRNISASSQILIYLGLTMAGINLINSVYDYRSYSGTDLRVRIVGVRAMLRGINPYTLDYSPKLPEILQDPSQYRQGLSRCPYPPSLLLLYAPLSPLPYRVIRGISIGLEWCALIATIALLARTLRGQQLRAIFVIIALTAFAGGYFWRLHLERGQYHIFVTLMIASGVYQVSTKRQDSWLIGVPFGLALSMRPTIAVVLLFLFLAKFPKTVVSAIGTALVVILLTLPFGGVRFWQDWLTLVGRYENLIVGIKDNSQLIDKDQRFPAEGFYPRRNLEGKTDNSSAVGMLILLLNQGKIQLEPPTIKLLAKISLAVISLALLSLFIWAYYRKKFGVRFTLFAAILLTIITEFSAPIRYGYADTQFLLLVALSLPLFLRPSGRFLASIVILSFLIGGYLPVKATQNFDLSRTLLFLTPNVIMYSGTLIKRSRKLNQV